MNSFNPSIIEQINHAAELLNQHEVVGMPTETVYGLAARVDSEVGIGKIFSVKERPFFDPLIVHVSNLKQAKSCVLNWNEMCGVLSAAFWPGPLTLVLPKSDLISDLITSGLASVGLRWPSHIVAQLLIAKAGVPLAAPSANKFGRTSPTKFQHVNDEFGKSVFVIEADASEIGIESTVLSVKLVNGSYELAILRKGSVLKSEITEKIKEASSSYDVKYVWVDEINKKESPGHMQHHYMPSIPFVICKDVNMKLSELAAKIELQLKNTPDFVEGVKMIKPLAEIKNIEFLKLPTDPVIAAREMYSQLRAASQRSPDVLCFIQTSNYSGEMWESVFDRLYKAAILILD